MSNTTLTWDAVCPRGRPRLPGRLDILANNAGRSGAPSLIAERTSHPRALLALISAAAAIAACSIPEALAAPGISAPPGAAEFARDVVGTTTAYADAHADAARIENVHCVQASSGHYMCSYAVTRTNRLRECHLMQATWTPRLASTFTVTLAGRVKRCATLQQALGSLG